MKKLFLILLCMFIPLVFSGQALADRSVTKTADALIDTGKGLITGIMVITDGSNSATIAIYDNTSGSGTKLIPDWIVTTSSSNRAATLTFKPGESYANGLYVDVTCSGDVSYMVYYDPMD